MLMLFTLVLIIYCYLTVLLNVVVIRVKRNRYIVHLQPHCMLQALKFN